MNLLSRNSDSKRSRNFLTPFLAAAASAVTTAAYCKRSPSRQDNSDSTLQTVIDSPIGLIDWLDQRIPQRLRTPQMARAIDKLRQYAQQFQADTPASVRATPNSQRQAPASTPVAATAEGVTTGRRH